MTRIRRVAVYGGSFDPLTIGHTWMIEEGSRLFDRLIVALGVNPEKRYTFSVEERLSMLRVSTGHLRNVEVASIGNQFLISYAKSARATHILRGIRSESDYEYE